MDLRARITPDDPAFHAAAQTTWHERADLRQHFGAADSEGYARWLATSGVLELPERFARFYPPVPPEDLRRTGCGGTAAHGHLWSGLDDFDAVADCVETFSGAPLDSFSRVLDFGAGCGRLLRWFQVGVPAAELVGVELRRASVDWCRAHLRGDYHYGTIEPKLDLPDGAVDLAVALSLFSHFTRTSNLAWFKELVRVCRPGGLILATTHGPFSLSVIARSAEHQRSFFMTGAQARGYLRGLHDKEFQLHVPPPEWSAALEVGPDYAQAFLTGAFVEREWEPYARVLGCVPARLFLFQDVWVLERRARATSRPVRT
jgi:SAM-dependent methyltransferase